MTEPPALPPVDEGAATVAPEESPVRRSFPLRWAIAGAATVALAAAAAAAWFVLSHAPVQTAAAAWLPQDTVAYVEISTDLTADQRDKILGLLKAFPGFADQSRLGDKLDETGQQLLAGAGIDYRAQVKPWLGDSAALALRSPTAADAGGGAAAVLASTNDDAARTFAKTLADRAVKAGATVSSETVDGVTVTTLKSAGPAREPACALAVVDGRLVAGDPYLVRAAVAVRRAGAPSLASRDAFRAAISTLPPDRVAALWVDVPALLEAAQSGLATFAPGKAALGLLAFEPGSALVGYARAEDEGVVVEITGRGGISGAALLSPPPGSGPRSSRLAASAPMDTALFLDLHDVGPRVRAALDALRLAVPGSGGALGDVDRTLTALGTSLDELSAAVGDVAVVVTVGDQPRPALIVEVTQPAVATRLVGQADALLGLSGLAQVSTSDYRGVTLHTVRPVSGALPVRGLSPTYALAGDALIVGLDREAVTAIIDVRGGGAALTADPDYQAVAARVGAQNNGAFYANLGRLFGAFGGKGMSAEARAFIAPFRAFGGALAAPGEHEWFGPSRFFVLVR